MARDLRCDVASAFAVAGHRSLISSQLLVFSIRSIRPEIESFSFDAAAINSVSFFTLLTLLTREGRMYDSISSMNCTASSTVFGFFCLTPKAI